MNKLPEYRILAEKESSLFRCIEKSLLKDIRNIGLSVLFWTVIVAGILYLTR